MRYDLQYVDTLTLTDGGDGAGAEYRLVNGLNNDDYNYWGVWLKFRGRAVIGTAAATLVPVLSPTTFIERIFIEGNLAGGQKITLVDLPASLLFTYAALATGLLPKFDEDNLVSSAGAVGTYDFDFDVPVPFCIPSRYNAGVDLERRTLLPGNLFSSPISLMVRTGGNDSIIDRAATSTVTMSAFGVGTGSPTCEIHRVIDRIGRGRIVQGQKYISQKTAITFTTALQSAVTNGILGRIAASQIYSRILLRVGDLSSDSDPALGAVSNTVLTRIYLRQGKQQLRDFQFLSAHSALPWFGGYNEGWRELIGTAAAGYTGGQATREFVGTVLLDFVRSGVLEDVLVLDPRRASELEIWGDVVAPAATQQLEAVTDTLLPRA